MRQRSVQGLLHRHPRLHLQGRSPCLHACIVRLGKAGRSAAAGSLASQHVIPRVQMSSADVCTLPDMLQTVSTEVCRVRPLLLWHHIYPEWLH